MKQSSLQKLNPVFDLIRTTLAEPVDFIRLTLVFGSGRTELTGLVVAADAAATAFQYRFPGRSGQAGAAAVVQLLQDLCAQYDRVRLQLEQRGSCRLFTADDTGIRITPGIPARQATAPGAGALGTAQPPSDRPGVAAALSGTAHGHGNDGHSHGNDGRGHGNDGHSHGNDGHGYWHSGGSDQAGRVHPFGTSSKRDYWIQVGEADALLQAIGVTDAQGKLRNDKLRKYHQIDRFVELADPLIRSLLAQPADRPLQVVDLACGKSYLSFVLNYYIREKLGKPCQLLGVDYADGVIAASTDLAARLGYRNMQFLPADLNSFQLTGPVDLAISLHACDTATDLALAAAIQAKARAIIVVPCCQRELLASRFSLPVLEKSILASGVLKARFADLLTDSLRLLLLRAAGYDAAIVEYVSPLDTPKNLMIRAIQTGRPDPAAWQEYRALIKTCGATITLGRLMEETGRWI